MRYMDASIRKVDAFLTRRRVLFYSVVVLVVVCAMYSGYLLSTRGVGISAAGYGARMIGGRIMLEGKRSGLYDLRQQALVQGQILVDTPVTLPATNNPSNTQRAAPPAPQAAPDLQNDYAGLHFYVSPPLVAALFAPFAALPYVPGVVLWTLFSVTLIVASLRLIWPIVPNLHHFGFPHVLLVAMATAPAVLVLAAGQDAAVALLLFALGLRLLLARRDGWAGAILGLGLYKPQLFILVPILLLVQHRWRALGAWVGMALLLVAGSLALVGLDGARAYVDLLSSDLYHQRVDIMQARNMLSVVALMRSLGLGSIATLAGAGAGLLLAVGFGRLALKPLDDHAFILLYAAAILATVLITPHVLVYDAVILFIPALIVLNEAPRSAVVRVSLAGAAFMLLLFPLHSGHFGVAPWTVVPITVLLVQARRMLRARHRPYCI